jgi:hypothetical protein
MDIGNSIIAACGIVSGTAGTVAVIYKLCDRKSKPVETAGICLSHSGIQESIKNIEEGLKEIRDDVKSLLGTTGK